MAKDKILVVDDEDGVCSSLRGILEDEGFVVETCSSGEECLRLTKKELFDLVMLDVWLPRLDGLQVLEKLKAGSYSARIIMISGHANVEMAVRATKLGAFDFIEKPLSLDKTLLVINNALRQKRLEEENRLLKAKLEDRYAIIGESEAMKKLKEQIKIAAPTNGRVLIFGENGTGKELVARAIRRESLRASAPFIEVNCAAIPDELIESELFGHVRGSFTGAITDKVGKFEQADGGTLFLDEVGDMSYKTQSKVLRVLEEQRFERVGGGEPIEVDIRVIAATNKNLEEEIRKGNFRDDLYFRLNVIPLYVPHLRERLDDLPLLVSHFLELFSREYGQKPKQVTTKAIEQLQQYSWPGNVRELKNMVERLVIMVPSHQISREAVEMALMGRAEGENRELYSFASLREARHHFERVLILRKLKENNFNITRAAKALQIDRTALHRRIKSLGLEPLRDNPISRDR